MSPENRGYILDIPRRGSTLSACLLFPQLSALNLHLLSHTCPILSFFTGNALSKKLNLDHSIGKVGSADQPHDTSGQASMEVSTVLRGLNGSEMMRCAPCLKELEIVISYSPVTQITTM